MTGVSPTGPGASSIDFSLRRRKAPLSVTENSARFDIL
eukprot:CAMPEP_0176451368 /NCGR_PEP_ID=MMETSP0127-20121128/27788_1 /TAXON_ID=938130 /ORGANISM="Platyophrya macrostoma, Strain WH" /LENGTH=37 /DNA_ID= /DNA_START= /DNA_END= /DNA_ORIENTATION=